MLFLYWTYEVIRRRRIQRTSNVLEIQNSMLASHRILIMQNFAHFENKNVWSLNKCSCTNCKAFHFVCSNTFWFLSSCVKRWKAGVRYALKLQSEATNTTVSKWVFVKFFFLSYQINSDQITYRNRMFFFSIRLYRKEFCRALWKV